MRRSVVAATTWVLGLASVGLTSVILPAGPASAAGLAVTAPGGFTTLAPIRLLDTRTGVGAPKAAVAAGGTAHLEVTGRGGVPATGVSAVALNVTVTAPAKPGFLTVYPDGTTRPGTSNLNFVAAQTVPNLAIVPVGHNRKVALYNGSTGTVQLIADVSGYYLSGTPSMAGTFRSLTPSRMLDTRTGTGAPKVAVSAGGTVHLQIIGQGGLPASGISAVVLNVTVTEPAKPGFLTVYRDATIRPNASNLNFGEGQTVANLVVAPVAASGQVANGKVALYNGSTGTVQLIADVSGYYRSGTPSVTGAFGSLTPSRLLDTRTGTGAPKVAVAALGTVHVQVSGQGGVPASGVSAVVLNVTATEPTAPGYLSVYRSGTTRPVVSNLNFVTAQTVPNLVIARVGTNGKVALYNGSTGSVQLVADVSGYYLGEITSAVMVSAGTAHTCALTSTGGVKCWGGNLDGQLGNGTTNGSAVPVDVTGLGSGVVAVSAGERHSCAVTSAGAVKCWGFNLSGQLGNGTTTSSTVPVDVVGLSSGAVAVSAGGSHTCALTQPGAIKCWGSNGYGQLGDGNHFTSSTVPVDVVGLGEGSIVVSAGGSHTCARTTLEAVRCWGYNDYGQLGNATNTSSVFPVLAKGLGLASVAVSAGLQHSCARNLAGAVFCWGDNEFGQLGNGTTTGSRVPIAVTGLSSGALAISAGGWHTCELTTAGELRCWGYNAYGQLGNGTTASSSLPAGVVGFASGAVTVSAGGYHSCAVTSADGVNCWGANNNGELGNGTTTSSAVPVFVTGLG